MPAQGSGTHSGVPPGFEQSTYTGEHQAPSVAAVALPGSQPVAGRATPVSLRLGTDKTAPESVRSPIDAHLVDSIEEAPSPPAESAFDVINASDSGEPASVPLIQRLAPAEGDRHEQQDVATACRTRQVGLHTRLFVVDGFIQPHTFTCEDEVTPRREVHAHADAGGRPTSETSPLVSGSTHAFSPPSNAARAGSSTADGSASMTSLSTLFCAPIPTLTPPVLGSAALYDSDDSQSSYGEEIPANGKPTSRPLSLGSSRAARPEYPPIGWEQDGRTQGEGSEPAQVTKWSAASVNTYRR